MTFIMYDSVTISEIPAHPQAVAGYVGGSFTNFNQMVHDFPKAHHLSIAPQASMHARCLDVEPLDAINSQAPGWFHTNADHSQGRPVLYTSASNVGALITTMAAAGIPRTAYLVWSAHYNFIEHICGPHTCGFPQAEATQWTDKALNRNLDQSLVSDLVFIAPPPADPHHYRRFYGDFTIDTLKLNERDTVEEYDRRRKLPAINKQRLKILEWHAGLLAGRVWTVAHSDRNKDGKPSWNKFYRGWRYQQLIHRSQGKKVV